MSSTIKTLIDKYTKCKQATKEARQYYDKIKYKTMRLLRYENQTKEEIDYQFNKVAEEEAKGYSYLDDRQIPISKKAHYYNTYLIPPTMMNKNVLRKKNAEECKRAKELVKFLQRIEEIARKKLLRYFDERTVWFIATVRDVLQDVEPEIKKAKGLPENYQYENHESRTWGFYYDLDKALKAVQENWTDMNEAGYYDYAVIEPHKVGLMNVEESINNTIWFKAEYEDRKTEAGTPYKCCVSYKGCEKPKWAEHIVGWCLN